MNHRLVLSVALALGCFGFGCDKSESPAGQAIAAQAGKTVEPTATPVLANAAANEGAMDCAGDMAEGRGEDCMKKQTEGEGMGCNQWDEAANEVAKREIPADVEWQVLNVTGMSCGGCERRIIANVGELEGVVAVEADSELSQVRVAVVSGNPTASKDAISKIGELGYTVQ